MKRPRIPVFVEPMLPTRADEIPAGSAWLHEERHEGYRILAYLNYGDIRLLSRSGHSWTRAFAPIAEALRKIGDRQAIVDGEVTVRGRNSATNAGAVRTAARNAPDMLVYFAFDLLWLDGFDLRGQDLIERKKRLKALIAPAAKTGRVIFADHVPGPKGRALLKKAPAGIVSKRADSPYWGGPSPVWLKIAPPA